MSTFQIHCSDVLECLRGNANIENIKLVCSSPPYNIGKAYEKRTGMDIYAAWQSEVIDAILPRMSDDGVFCWQVGTHVTKNEGIFPLDYLFIPMLIEKGLHFQARYIWHFEHGLHRRHSFSGRSETILLFSKQQSMDHDPAIILPAGQEPPDDEHISDFMMNSLTSGVWDMPVVNHNHPEKIAGAHPCQFPVGLAERVILGVTQPGDLVFDPFAGMASTGVAALIHGRDFIGTERDPSYAEIASERLRLTQEGKIEWRPYDKPVNRPNMHRP